MGAGTEGASRHLAGEDGGGLRGEGTAPGREAMPSQGLDCPLSEGSMETLTDCVLPPST